MLLDLEATATNVLEMTAYFQGKQTVDDYLPSSEILFMIPDTLT